MRPVKNQKMRSPERVPRGGGAKTPGNHSQNAILVNPLGT